VSEVGGNVGIATMTPSGKLHIFGGATSDVFAGMGVDMIAGPAFNFGYGGASFGRSAGFFNVRPDAMASAPNPSLRFMTANSERMIITNAGDIGIGTSTPGGRFHIYAAPTADVFAGIGTNMSVGPSFNFGYGGASFGRGAGFFNVRPDPFASSPNPSLRFMTNNAERMIITVDGSVGIGTSTPAPMLDVFGDIFGRGNLNISAAVTAAGASFTGAVNAQYVGATNAFQLPQTTGGPIPGGLITLAGSPWAHSYGSTSVFLGTNAGNFTMNGFYHTAAGYYSLSHNTTGYRNASSGAWTLFNNTDGYYNSAFGTESLFSNTTGPNNTAVGGLALYFNTTACCNSAVGYAALQNNTTGSGNAATGIQALSNNASGGGNSALGQNALYQNTTGNQNIGIGYYAGFNLTTGNYNIDIGNQGAAAEANTIRIGDAVNHTRAFIAGIRGVTTGAVNAVSVMIDSNGQLGTMSSSRRYKFDIADMAKFTDRLMQLRPVTFRYKKYGDDGPLQAGLIAEEVAEIYPELVTHDKDGQPETVMYQFLAPMLLDVVQKQQKTIETLERRLEALEKQLAIH
jgi:hypothetical protein